ncbi:ABC transporter ATP-binding protein [Yinghuangia soli]|uniref:ABC transporter ATP-binding protein n=1 Tax=Yinghuangia soli TaxID=2908204 RepID=A0AA41Q9T0_9ACTN|nr:ABC transporter ATP-binding protein [Yinghuangia soli]MCF2533861.1 ABC transporter ATP-binding protein [Yinghuangia soli]
MRPPPATAPPDELVVDDLTVVYGRSIQALTSVTLRAPVGGIVALLGANGAGKSTLLRAVSGTLPLHTGSIAGGTIHFGERPLTSLPPADVVAAGVVQVPEGRRVFSELSVEENLRAGLLGTPALRRPAARDAVDRIFGLFPVLAERRRQSAGLLSGGEQQMLALGRALMAGPRMLLLDEPSLGLAPQIVERIAQIVRDIHAQGTGVLLVEQNAALALELSDHAYVLDVGRIRLDGPSDELSCSDDIRRLYLGEQDEEESALAPAALPELARWSG